MKNKTLKMAKAWSYVTKTCAVAALMTVCTVTNVTPQVYEVAGYVEAATRNLIVEKKPVIQSVKRSKNKITLQLENVKGATSYQVYRSTKKDGTYSLVGKTTKTTYEDKNVKSDQTYYYKVRGVQGENKSKYSSVVKVSANLGKVTGLYAEDKVGNVMLSWNKVNKAKQYKVYRSGSETGTYTYLGSTKTTSYSDDSVKAGKTYYYKVRATSQVNDVAYTGAYSKEMKITIATDTDSSQLAYMKEVLRLVNIERKNGGLSLLESDSKLEDAANKRAVETVSTFSHTRPDGTSCFSVLEEFSINYRTSGENIAYGQRTPEEVVNAWMNSEGHRANIMNGNFHKLGVGCYLKNGTYYWVQLFTD